MNVKTSKIPFAFVASIHLLIAGCGDARDSENPDAQGDLARVSNGQLTLSDACWPPQSFAALNAETTVGNTSTRLQMGFHSLGSEAGNFPDDEPPSFSVATGNLESLVVTTVESGAVPKVEDLEKDVVSADIVIARGEKPVTTPVTPGTEGSVRWNARAMTVTLTLRDGSKRVLEFDARVHRTSSWCGDFVPQPLTAKTISEVVPDDGTPLTCDANSPQGVLGYDALGRVRSCDLDPKGGWRPAALTRASTWMALGLPVPDSLRLGIAEYDGCRFLLVMQGPFTERLAFAFKGTGKAAHEIPCIDGFSAPLPEAGAEGVLLKGHAGSIKVRTKAIPVIDDTQNSSGAASFEPSPRTSTCVVSRPWGDFRGSPSEKGVCADLVLPSGTSDAAARAVCGTLLDDDLRVSAVLGEFDSCEAWAKTLSPFTTVGRPCTRERTAGTTVRSTSVLFATTLLETPSRPASCGERPERAL